MNKNLILFFGLLAQLVLEQRTVNPWVTGSNPVQPEALLGRFRKLNKTPMRHIP